MSFGEAIPPRLPLPALQRGREGKRRPAFGSGRERPWDLPPNLADRWDAMTSHPDASAALHHCSRAWAGWPRAGGAGGAARSPAGGPQPRSHHEVQRWGQPLVLGLLSLAQHRSPLLGSLGDASLHCTDGFYYWCSGCSDNLKNSHGGEKIHSLEVAHAHLICLLQALLSART